VFYTLAQTSAFRLVPKIIGLWVSNSLFPHIVAGPLKLMGTVTVEWRELGVWCFPQRRLSTCIVSNPYQDRGHRKHDICFPVSQNTCDSFRESMAAATGGSSAQYKRVVWVTSCPA
jgi:hypothetical protein